MIINNYSGLRDFFIIVCMVITVPIMKCVFYVATVAPTDQTTSAIS